MGDPETIRVIYIDDNLLELKRVKKTLDEKFAVECFKDVTSFRARIKAVPTPDLFLLDFDLGCKDDDGVSLARECRTLFPDKSIVLVTGHSNPTLIQQAFACGADDFICKHSDGDPFDVRLKKGLQLAHVKKGILSTPPTPLSASKRPRPTIVGSTMNRISNRIPLILASAASSVSVEGESGTGKEVIADILESFLPSNTPFIRINCAEIAPSLMESELFGYKKGTFTGASEDRIGLIESANGGWVFLDEITLLTPQAQGALLRVLENKTIRRIGEYQTRPINVRLLCAGNEPLKQLVAKKLFRNDLWQRLKEVEIKLPPLRERRIEIPDLIDHFCITLPGAPYHMTNPAKQILFQCQYKDGNIRELRNLIKAMTELKINQLLTPLAIPPHVWDELKAPEKDSVQVQMLHATQNLTEPAAVKIPVNSNQQRQLTIPWDPHEPFQDLCDRVLLSILTQVQGQKSLRALAKELKIARATLAAKLNRLKNRRLISEDQLKFD